MYVYCFLNINQSHLQHKGWSISSKLLENICYRIYFGSKIWTNNTFFGNYTELQTLLTSIEYEHLEAALLLRYTVKTIFIELHSSHQLAKIIFGCYASMSLWRCLDNHIPLDLSLCWRIFCLFPSRPMTLSSINICRRKFSIIVYYICFDI